MKRCAILDDYQGVALELADWSAVADEVTVTSFRDHLVDLDEIATRLREFEIVCLMRERTPFPESLIQKLPDLRLLLTSGMRNSSIDIAAAQRQGIVVAGTFGAYNATAELTWALILSLLRQIPREDKNIREGRWQETVGGGLEGKVLGIIGLGKLGTPVAKVGQAFGMDVIAWSQNLSEDRCKEAGVRLAEREEIFREADIISIHMILSDQTRDLVGAKELELMKPTAYLVNTSRWPIVDGSALSKALHGGQIAGAALDVYDVEPLPPGDPIRSLPNTVLTPHLGYVTDTNYRIFFSGFVEDIRAWLDGNPIHVIGGAG